MIEIIPNWHPIFVHFTIALLSTASLLIVASLFFRNNFGEKLLNGGYLNLWLGCLFATATVAAGFHAYATVAHDTASHAAMTDHRNWALATASLFWVLGLCAIPLYRADKKRHPAFVAGLVMATALLMVTGWKGAEVVYRHGIGVISLPNADAHQHQHAEELAPAGHIDAQPAPPAVPLQKPEARKHNHASHSHTHSHD